MNFNQTKVDLIESLKRTREILGNRSWTSGVINKVEELDIPALKGEWEYNIKWLSKNNFQIIKYRLVKNNNGIWEHLDEEVVAELAI